MDQLCTSPHPFPFNSRTLTRVIDDAADVFTWSITEISIGFIVANLLELAPLLRRWGVRGFSDESHATFEVMSADVVRLDDVDKSRHVASVKSVYD